MSTLTPALAARIGLMRVPLLLFDFKSQILSAFVNVWQLRGHVLVGDENAVDVAKISEAEIFSLLHTLPPFSLPNYPE